MKNNTKKYSLWQSHRAAWDLAEHLQQRCDDPKLLFCGVYDLLQKRWLVNCIDTSERLKERFHGGHRSYYREIWRQQ